MSKMAILVGEERSRIPGGRKYNQQGVHQSFYIDNFRLTAGLLQDRLYAMD